MARTGRALKKANSRPGKNLSGPDTIRPEVYFFAEGISFTLRDKTHVRTWLANVAARHKKRIGALTYIFVSDKHLLALNKRHLSHDTLTDIITFDYSEKNVVSGDIYISIERVHENAATYQTTKRDELHRVMAHGLLHLCGFGDKSARQAKQMRAEEEKALDLRQF